MKSKIYYTIKKTFLKTNQSVVMNNSLGEVLELENQETVELMVETLNSNTDSNCRYSIIKRGTHLT